MLEWDDGLALRYVYLLGFVGLLELGEVAKLLPLHQHEQPLVVAKPQLRLLVHDRQIYRFFLFGLDADDLGEGFLHRCYSYSIYIINIILITNTIQAC